MFLPIEEITRERLSKEVKKMRIQMLKGLKDQAKMHQDPKREHDEEKGPE